MRQIKSAQPAFSAHYDRVTLTYLRDSSDNLQTAISGCLTDQQVWFPVDFQETTCSRKFSRICSFIDIYRAGSLTDGITLILFTQAIAQLNDIFRRLIAEISINPGLLQDVFTGTLWSTRILSQPENFQETLLISSRFPGVLDTLYKYPATRTHRLNWLRQQKPISVLDMTMATKWWDIKIGCNEIKIIA